MNLSEKHGKILQKELSKGSIFSLISMKNRMIFFSQNNLNFIECENLVLKEETKFYAER
jgi:hypothetical protein